MALNPEALKEYRRLRTELLSAIDTQRVADMSVGINDDPYTGPTDMQTREQRRLAHVLTQLDALVERFWG